MSNLQPVKLRAHLIPFFYKELHADIEAKFNNTNSKACKLVVTSSFAKLIKSALEKSLSTIKPKKYYLYFCFQEKMLKKEAHFYINVNGENLVLQGTPELSNDINEIFEDIFRYTFANRISNIIKYAPHLTIDSLIQDFMVEYQLDDYEFTVQNLRRLYNREIGKESGLKRFQEKASKRVANRFMS